MGIEDSTEVRAVKLLNFLRNATMDEVMSWWKDLPHDSKLGLFGESEKRVSLFGTQRGEIAHDHDDQIKALRSVEFQVIGQHVVDIQSFLRGHLPSIL